MTLAEFQADLRRAYLGGGIGAVVSGLVWAAAAVVHSLHGLSAGYTTLFFGGFVIFPLSTLLEKVFFKRGPLRPGNPGGGLVMETLPAMLSVLVICFWLIDIRPDWVFPLAAIAVGTHYFPVQDGLWRQDILGFGRFVDGCGLWQPDDGRHSVQWGRASGCGHRNRVRGVAPHEEPHNCRIGQRPSWFRPRCRYRRLRWTDRVRWLPAS